MEVNFKALDWSEYKGFRYEADANGRVCIFDQYTNYITTVDTVEEADQYVDLNWKYIKNIMQ